MDENTHYIRINNIQTPVRDESKKTFNGTVTFKDLQSGLSISLRDSTVDFSGFITHNFVLEENLKLKHRYQFIVEGQDGTIVTSNVTAPGLTEVSITPNAKVLCEQQVEFIFKNVEKPEHVRMEVGFQLGGKIQWAEIGLVDKLKHREDSDEMSVTLSPRNLLVDVFPPPIIISTTNPRNIMPTILCHQLDSNMVHIRYTHYGPEWDVYSPGYFPIDPLEWQDVEGGLGFLGAFRQDSTTFTIQL